MTPDEARARIAHMKPYAQSDPEVWHGFIDQLQKDALRSISQTLHGATDLATAVLEADAIPVAWTACA